MFVCICVGEGGEEGGLHTMLSILKHKIISFNATFQMKGITLENLTPKL